MDGTLTVAVHEFDMIRARLGLPVGRPILESLDALPATRSAPLREELRLWELDLAQSASAALGAQELLATLSTEKLGILTRNTQSHIGVTLKAAGLDAWFPPPWRLGRDDAAPKPSPEGIARLLAAWELPPEEVVMVGDYLFDVLAGRAAGVKTVLVDSRNHGLWREHADRVVQDLRELLD